jgi:putative oxidoreductase
MSAPAQIRRATEIGLKVAAILAFLPPLVTRVVLGHAFYLTGKGKLANFDNVVGFFTSLGIPMPEFNAAFVSRLEFYGGLLLVAGLLTRLVAAGLASTMVVALLTADRESFVGAIRGTGEAGATDMTAFVFLVLLSWLVIYGAGLVSVDALLARWLRMDTAVREIPPQAAAAA